MNHIEIIANQQHYSLIIDKVKYLIGSNFSAKYDIINTIDRIFNGSAKSEYSEENGNEIALLYNGNRFMLKSWKFFIVHPWINLDDDLKLGTKSILLRYLECMLSEIEFEDSFVMLNQAIELLNQNYLAQQAEIRYHDHVIASAMKQFSSKTILKSLLSTINIDELSAETFDLSYQDKTILYIRMIKGIAKRSVCSNHLLAINIPVINASIARELSDFPDNLIALVISDSLKTRVNARDIALFGKGYIDLGNEESVYNKLLLEHASDNNLRSYLEHLNNEIAQNLDNLFNISCLARYI